MILIALDPGLDATGYAVFRVPLKPPVHANQYRGALLESGTLRSATDADLPHRLARLAVELSVLLAAQAPDVVLIEVPAIAGIYRRQAERARDAGAFGAAAMTAMHHATGALILAAHQAGVEVVTRRAATVGKPAKTAWVVGVWPELGGRKSNQDQRDAIYLGATALGQYAAEARRAA